MSLLSLKQPNLCDHKLWSKSIKDVQIQCHGICGFDLVATNLYYNSGLEDMCLESETDIQCFVSAI